jgi:hypothetical protein
MALYFLRFIVLFFIPLAVAAIWELPRGTVFRKIIEGLVMALLVSTGPWKWFEKRSTDQELH